MLKEEVEKQLRELENCEYVNFHFKNGEILSCPPCNIIVYLDEDYIEIPNSKFKFCNLSYIDSYC